MATAATRNPSMDERTNKRLKGPDEVPHDGRRASPYPSQHPMQGRYPPPPYGPPPPYHWPPHYGSQGPPGHSGPTGPPPGPPVAPGGPPPSHWGPMSYGHTTRTPPPSDRGSWPPNGAAPYGARSRKPKPMGKREDEMEGRPGGPPPYWAGGPSGHGPPPHGPGPYGRGGGAYWQQAGPMYPQGPGPWSKSPPRRSARPEMMGGYPPGRGEEMGYMSTRTIQAPSQSSHYDDDGANSSAGGSAKDKGRGSYKCGRCGVPKKGHVCPYQPKVKRRPDEPPPEMRNAAVQVERDEFMTLRRLNIKIQGLPESYVTEPYMGESMVVGEVNPMGVPPLPPSHGHPPMEDELLSERVLGSSASPTSPDIPTSSPSPPTAGSPQPLPPVDSSDLKDVVEPIVEEALDNANEGDNKT